MCQNIGNIMGSDQRVNLPPGFVFSPTDEELVLHFLYPKAFLLPWHHHNIIPDLDLSLFHPFQLNGKALSSGNQFYFFSKYKKKRVTEIGYWKEIGVSESVVSAAGNKVGMKKYLVFNNGEEAPHGTETSWVMQEYRLCSSGFNNNRRTPKPDKSKWVLCRVYEKKRDSEDDDDEGGSTELSWMDQMYMSTLEDEDDDNGEVSFP